MNEITKYKKCPHCGFAVKKNIINNITIMECTNCPASMKTGLRGDAEQWWNRRNTIVSRIIRFFKKGLY